MVVITPHSLPLIVTIRCDLLRFMGPMWLAAFPGVFLKPGNRQCLGYKWHTDVLVFSVILTTVSVKYMEDPKEIFYKTLSFPHLVWDILSPNNMQCPGKKWHGKCFTGYYCKQKINWIEHFKVSFLDTIWVIWSGNIILIKLWYSSNINEKLFLYIYINQPYTKCIAIDTCNTWASAE